VASVAGAAVSVAGAVASVAVVMASVVASVIVVSSTCVVSVGTLVGSANFLVVAGCLFLATEGEYAVENGFPPPQLGQAGTALFTAGTHLGQAGTAGLAGTQQILPFFLVDCIPCADGTWDTNASTTSAATTVE